ncbi:MAG: TonB family protein [Candidatus Omnitrophota bacterium]
MMLINKNMKKIIVLISLLLAFVWLGISDGVMLSQWEDEIFLIQGGVATVGVVSPRRVGIANPAVADIESVNKDEVILVGKAIGTTTLSIWDKLGQRILNVKVVAEDLDYLKARLEKLLSDEMDLREIVIRINKEEGKVVLLGKVRPDQEENVGLVLKPFSDKIINLIRTQEDVLVQIDVQVLELSKDDTDTLGIDWLDAMNITEEPVRGTTTTASGGVVTTLNRTGDLIRVVEFSRDALSAKINLLVTRGKGRILSRPKLVCLSGKEAQLVVGGQLPIVTTTSTSTTVTSNIQYRDYGIVLNIKPTVTEDNQINTQLKTEVSEIDTARAVQTTTYYAPAFSTRTVDTELILRDGQTVFLAGLIKNKETTTMNKFPGLADVPILGALFRSKSFIKGDTELVISLSPTIIHQKTPSIAETEEKAIVPTLGIDEPEDPLLKYIKNVQKIIADAIYYPSQAKDAGWEGKVNLKLHIRSGGELADIDIVNTSGYQLLDDAAISVAKGLSPYPPFPASVESDDIWVEVPVVFLKD